MKREEMIRKAKTAKDPEELAGILKDSGMGEITTETAEKLFNVLHSSKELTDEELDVSAGAEIDASAGGCFLFNKTVCPNCHGVGNFSTVTAKNPDGVTSTVHCNNCDSDVVVPMPGVQ